VIAVLGLMVYVIIPQLAEVLEGTGEQLPILTLVVIAFADFIRSWGWFLIIFFIALVLVGCFWTGCINSRNFVFSIIVIMSQNLVIASSSWLILEMDKPFQGYFKVDNQAFINVKQQIETFKF